MLSKTEIQKSKLIEIQKAKLDFRNKKKNFLKIFKFLKSRIQNKYEIQNSK